MTYKEWEFQNIIDILREKIMIAKDKNDYDEVRKLQQEMDLQIDKNKIDT